MNVSCPHCGTQLKFSDKFRASLEKLKPEQKARIKCSQCEKPFSIDRSILGAPAASKQVRRGQPASGGNVKPPVPPDVSWLQDGVFEEQEVVEEIPLALILIPEDAGRDVVVKSVEGLGYRAEIVTSVDLAMEKMQFVNYSSVLLHTEFEPQGLHGGTFHKFMARMSMPKRRYIFYALIGKDLNTLYDLEALAYSANIVVNERDIEHFGVILRKTIPEYEMLFGPIMEETRLVGH
ncbi:hypothetical protein [Desulfosediminicola sp.]|uniref:hypothetical protein n=1 Tax=Desulfosediminicola sp. TaxID=2886825 RepID=UPI003AF2D277